jgi:ATP-dependent Lon protease
MNPTPFDESDASDSGGGSNPARGPLTETPQPPIPDTLPVLPIRNSVLFPGIVAPLMVGRAASRRMLEESLPQNKVIGIFAQVDPRQEDPTVEGLRPVGVAAYVLKLVRQDDGNITIVVSVLERIAVRKVLSPSSPIRAEIDVLHSQPPPEDSSWQATVQQLRDYALELIRLTTEAPDQPATLVMNLQDPGRLADLLANGLNFDYEQKQQILEELDIAKRVRTVLGLVSSKLEIARLQQKIQKDVAAQFTEAQRRAYLQEQLRTIQKELGQGEESDGEQQAEGLRQRLKAAEPPEEVFAQADRELKRLARIHPASPEFSVIVTYVETLAELPWSKLTPDNLDLDHAQKLLDNDHFDLAKVKRRLIEYLAVRKLNPTGHGPILCFLGPPGVGKTSLGQSIADALGRKFVRLSLGGVRDEAEIRGHRRTYVGAMPGRLMQELRRAGSRNPVMMLDEIDKIRGRLSRRSRQRLARGARSPAEPHLRRSLSRRPLRSFPNHIRRHRQ